MKRPAIVPPAASSALARKPMSHRAHLKLSVKRRRRNEYVQRMSVNNRKVSRPMHRYSRLGLCFLAMGTYAAMTAPYAVFTGLNRC